MLSDTLSQTKITNFPLLALIIFMTVFALVIIRVVRSGRKNDRNDAMSQLPLADDEAPPSPHTPRSH